MANIRSYLCVALISTLAYFGRWTEAVHAAGVWTRGFVEDVLAAAFPARDLDVRVGVSADHRDNLSRDRAYAERRVAREPARPPVSAIRAYA